MLRAGDRAMRVQSSLSSWKERKARAMTGNTFKEGYALVIGVGADLPNTVGDAEGLANILQNPERCAYPRRGHVQLLTEKAAARDKVLDAFDLLARRADEQATVVVYFSGHGYRVENGGANNAAYYLMPYGYDVNRLPETTISGQEFAAKIEAIKSRKLLILLDCCHAGGLGVVTSPKGAVMKTPPGVTAVKAPLPVAAVNALAGGSGRAIIASSQASELSYAGEPYSAFTAALLEALCGAGAAQEDGFVRVTDLALYTREKVAARTNDLQHPTLDYDSGDNFKLAYYAGGAIAPKAPPFDAPQIEPQPGAWNPSPQVSWNVSIDNSVDNSQRAGRDINNTNIGNMTGGFVQNYQVRGNVTNVQGDYHRTEGLPRRTARKRKNPLGESGG